ncbi:hypothetical protein FACS1894142_6970 [Spirochaetia bacterium]|nr:hypothetical protein FACS1894142_6970 [Spirochaetia bacterium]
MAKLARKLVHVANEYYQIKGAIPLTNLIKITDYNSLTATPSTVSIFYYDQCIGKAIQTGDYLGSISSKPFCITIGSQDYELLTQLG